MSETENEALPNAPQMGLNNLRSKTKFNCFGRKSLKITLCVFYVAFNFMIWKAPAAHKIPTKKRKIVDTFKNLNCVFVRPTFATAQRTAMDLSVSRERAFL